MLIKFKLLELLEVELAKMITWAERTAHLETLRQSWYPELAMRDWIPVLVGELVANGVASRNGSRIVNT